MRKSAPKVDIPKASAIGFKQKPLLNQRLTTAIILLIVLFAVSYGLSLMVSSPSAIKAGNVAVIKIRNMITLDEVKTPFESTSSSSEIIRLIDAAEANPSVKAILFDINSPGGSAVASDELQNRISKINKTSVALIRDVGASGAYWAASAADIIVAGRLSVVGSVGVYSSYVELKGLLDRYNLTYRRLVSGKYKDIGSPLKEMSYDEQNIMQDMIDILHDEFVNSVAVNRNLTESQIKRISTAEIFSGRTAKDVGLVDVVGYEEDAFSLIEKKLNITAEPVVYEKEKTFWDRLRGLFYVGDVSLQGQVEGLEGSGSVVKA